MLRPKLFFRICGWTLGVLLCANAGQKEAATQPQSAPAVVGWYNGDWQIGLPGLANWFSGGWEFSRVYDDFIVPAGGWTVLGVFSNNRMESARVTKAAWEIRRDMAPGKGGKKVASGVSRATQVPIPENGPFPGESLFGYRIQVDGLHVILPPGRYWLSVAPVGNGGHWYASSTLGRNAVGDPPGNNGGALLNSPDLRLNFSDAGRTGRAQDFSQGVIILAAPGDLER
jgi:hypothetical protein